MRAAMESRRQWRAAADWALAGTRFGSEAALERRLEWAVPVHQPLLLISQIQRSGGTLLLRLLDDHPACFTHPYELSWGRPTKADWPRLHLRQSAGALFGALDERWVAQAIAAGGYRKGRLVDEAQPFVFSRSLQRRLFRARLGPQPPTQREVLDAYLTAFFNGWLDYQSLYRAPKQFVAAFTPRVHMHPQSRRGFWRDYPDGHLISIVRDPVSWYASARSHKARYADLENALALWSASAEGTLAARAEHEDRVTVVLFEDLVRDTEATMHRVCASTGLSFVPGVLTPTYNGRPARSNSSVAARPGIDGAAADRTSLLTVREVERVRELGGALYDRVRRSCTRGVGAASGEAAR